MAAWALPSICPPQPHGTRSPSCRQNRPLSPADELPLTKGPFGIKLGVQGCRVPPPTPRKKKKALSQLYKLCFGSEVLLRGMHRPHPSHPGDPTAGGQRTRGHHQQEYQALPAPKGCVPRPPTPRLGAQGPPQHPPYGAATAIAQRQGWEVGVCSLSPPTHTLRHATTNPHLPQPSFLPLLLITTTAAIQPLFALPCPHPSADRVCPFPPRPQASHHGAKDAALAPAACQLPKIKPPSDWPPFSGI